MVALSRHRKYLFPSGLLTATYLAFPSGKEALKLKTTFYNEINKAKSYACPSTLSADDMERGDIFSFLAA